MRIKENELRKMNTFDLLDTESLEEYLSKMALEGWMISKIGKIFLTFQKTDPKVIRFFVDITDKDSTDDNYTPTKDYIDSAKEDNLEHICGNEKFQIFINKGSKRNLDKRKLKFSTVFIEEFGIITNMLLSAMPLLFANSLFSDSFVQFISSNYLMIWIGLAAFFILFNLILIMLKLIKYRKIMKEDNHSFKEPTPHKPYHILNKYLTYTGALFIIFTILSVFGINTQDYNNISIEELPLSLEDFNISIEEDRDTTKSSSMSYFAKYEDYYDYTYKEICNKVYDEESQSYNEEYENINSFTLSYSIFESKYQNIMSKAVSSTLAKYNEYSWDYKKLTDKDELKYWGAKEVYVVDVIYDRVVVYEDRIITISSNLDYNKKNIDIIKSKIVDL